MKEKWIIKKAASKETLKSLVCFEDTHELLKEISSETGVSMAEIMRSALLFAYNNLEVEE